MFELLAIVPSRTELAERNNKIISELAQGIPNHEKLPNTMIKSEGLSQVCILSDKETSRNYIETENAHVFFTGYLYWDGHAINTENARDMVQSVLQNRSTAAQRLSGNFLLVILEKNTGCIFAFSDKVSSRSFYNVTNDECTVLSTNMLAIRKLQNVGFSLSVNRGSIFEFISSGHMWGNHTFWNEVSCLGPGFMGRFAPAESKVESYWKYTFEESYSSKVTVDDLWNAICEDFEKLPDSKYLISLSGGYDSRIIAYVLRKIKKRDCIAVSYSLGDNLTDSDQTIARRIADVCGIEFNTYTSKLDPDIYLASVPVFIEAQDAQTDVIVNRRSYLGSGYINYLNSFGRDNIVYGHEIWGWGDKAYDTNMAFWACSLFKFNEFPQPAKMINPKAFSDAQKHFDQMRIEYANEYPSNIRKSPEDLKDFLYWRHRESRVIMNGLKSLSMEFTTPFLGQNTIQVLRQAPGSMRIKKHLYMEMGRKYAPELFVDIPPVEPFYKGKSPFARLCESDKFRNQIADDLLERSPSCLTDIFSDGFELWLKNSLDRRGSVEAQTNHAQRIKYNVMKKANYILRKVPSLQAWVKHCLQTRGKLVFPCVDDDIISRLWILSRTLNKLLER